MKPTLRICLPCHECHTILPNGDLVASVNPRRALVESEWVRYTNEKKRVWNMNFVTEELYVSCVASAQQVFDDLVAITREFIKPHMLPFPSSASCGSIPGTHYVISRFDDVRVISAVQMQVIGIKLVMVNDEDGRVETLERVTEEHFLDW